MYIASWSIDKARGIGYDASRQGHSCPQAYSVAPGPARGRGFYHSEHMDDGKNVNQWTAKQRIFLEWLTLPTWERTPVSQQLLAQEIGVAEETLCRWKRLPGFDTTLHDMIRARLGDALPDVVGSFKAEAKKGQYQHQRTYFEMIGWYVPKIAPTNPAGDSEYSGGDYKERLLAAIERLAAAGAPSSDGDAE